MDTHQLQVLPLALIMVMGPQILTAIFLVTSREPVKNSVAMLIGVVLAACLSVAIWWGLVKALGINPRGAGGPDDLDYAVAAALAILGVRVLMTRGTAKVPKWMTTLQEAEPKRAFGLGFLLILLMPTDIIAVISAVRFLHDHGHTGFHAWPLVAMTTLLMALPILAYLLLGRRAREAMPGVREWLTANSWLVNLIVIVYFIYQMLK